MSRSAFVSSCGDPFLILLVQKLFKERWYDEVDEFLVNYNNHCGVPQNVVSDVLSRLAEDKKTHIIYHPTGIGNGMPITEMTVISKKDMVMLLEDDGFIFEGGIVHDCFKKIESDLTDIVGSPRGSCGQEIWDAAKEKYHLDYSGYGDVGPTWWPNFFFTKRSSLEKTDRNFASKTWIAGEESKELNHTFKEINHGDTFVWASLQLRYMGLRSVSVPQHKADPYEIQHGETKEQNWHPSQQPFKWIHGGSLSAGWGGYLSGVALPATDESSLFEMESRCAFWKLAMDITPGFTEFKLQYSHGIDDLIIRSKLDRWRINQKYNIYGHLMRII